MLEKSRVGNNNNSSQVDAIVVDVVKNCSTVSASNTVDSSQASPTIVFTHTIPSAEYYCGQNDFQVKIQENCNLSTILSALRQNDKKTKLDASITKTKADKLLQDIETNCSPQNIEKTLKKFYNEQRCVDNALLHLIKTEGSAITLEGTCAISEAFRARGDTSKISSKINKLYKLFWRLRKQYLSNYPGQQGTNIAIGIIVIVVIIGSIIISTIVRPLLRPLLKVLNKKQLNNMERQSGIDIDGDGDVGQ